jgi:hypothetical protein
MSTLIPEGIKVIYRKMQNQTKRNLNTEAIERQITAIKYPLE